jgi:putative tricarboxylic transport membrane protein
VKFNDALFGVVLLALGAAVLAAVQGFPKIPGQPVGPALFPGLIATALCITGVLLIARGLRMRREQPWVAFDDWVRSPRHLLALAVLLGAIVFYILVAERLGFLLTAPLILCALFLALRVPPARAVGIALLATLLVHLAFYKLLRVPLPWGVLKDYAW